MLLKQITSKFPSKSDQAHLLVLAFQKRCLETQVLAFLLWEILKILKISNTNYEV